MAQKILDKVQKTAAQETNNQVNVVVLFLQHRGTGFYAGCTMQIITVE